MVRARPRAEQEEQEIDTGTEEVPESTPTESEVPPEIPVSAEEALMFVHDYEPEGRGFESLRARHSFSCISST